MADCDLNAARLREVLDYKQETGIFTRRITTSTKVKVGDKAGSMKATGYVNIKVDGVLYQAHRLAWLHTYGEWPMHCIDHKNGIGSDNRLSNLREASVLQNMQNCKVRKDSSSGYTGVSYHPTSKKWQASISFNKKLNYLGVFDTAELANIAYKQAKLELHKFHPVQNLMR